MLLIPIFNSTLSYLQYKLDIYTLCLTNTEEIEMMGSISAMYYAFHVLYLLYLTVWDCALFCKLVESSYFCLAKRCLDFRLKDDSLICLLE